MLGFLVSLTGHELGHSYVADRNDVKVVEITLWLFGGVAKLEGDADNPGAEFRIAAAGPAMSMVMAGALRRRVVGRRPLDGSAVLGALLVWLALINVVLAVSNLLPAFPLDGGRMLRAILWRRSRRKLAATRTASLWGQILAVVLVVASLAIMRWASVWSGFWTLLLAAFLLVAARSEWRNAAARPELMLARVSGLGPPAPGAARAQLDRVGPGAHPGGQPGNTARAGVRRARAGLRRWCCPTRSCGSRRRSARVVPIASLTEPLWSMPRVHPEESVGAVLDRLGIGQLLAGAGHRRLHDAGRAVLRGRGPRGRTGHRLSPGRYPRRRGHHRRTGPPRPPTVQRPGALRRVHPAAPGPARAGHPAHRAGQPRAG